jgi:tRNA A37 threonylcarbamoyltransferase TsaD
VKLLQSLALEFQKPFVTVHHLEAHCVMARLAGKEIVAEEKKEEVVVNKAEEKAVDHNKIEIEVSVGTNANVNVGNIPSEKNTVESVTTLTQNGPGPFTPKVDYPFLALLASGGHTSILLCKNLGEYEVLGGTLDDALGEAFDKAARLLGLTCSSSGGAAVEAAAKLGDESSYPMTVPMRTKLNCDFSYAGLKNAFRMAVQSAREKEGLDVESTNAPANQMEESPTTVVS